MREAKVSVIIPVYNGAGVVAEAIRSVLGQSYGNFELLVVDDGSTDHSANVVGQFGDGRIMLIRHCRNAGADAARKTGLNASSGDVIAFLDQDDIFHPDKLLAHVEYLKRHPDVGLTYNPSFVLSHPSRTRQGILRPPEFVELKDILLGFPIPPSAMVVRREWALRDEFWAEDTFYRGREVVFCGRLILAGCRMALVDRVLNWRREYLGRRVTAIERAADEEILCQDILLEDSRCPAEIQSLRLTARANTCLEFAYVACRQGDFEPAQRLFRKAVDARPDLLDRHAAALLRFLLLRSTANVPEDHEAPLKLAQRTLARVYPDAVGKWDQVIAEGYLYRGGRAAIWGEPNDAEANLRRASAAGVAPGAEFADFFCHEMWSYEREHGSACAARRMKLCLSLLGSQFGRSFARHLRARYYFNRALRTSQSGARWQVAKDCARAMLGSAGYFRNRGTAALLVRAVVGRRMWAYGHSRGWVRNPAPACSLHKADDYA